MFSKVKVALLSPSLQSFQRLVRYANKFKSNFYWGYAFSFLKKLFDIAPEILIGVAIDVVVNREKSWLAQLGFETPMQQLIFLSSLTLVVWILESICENRLIVTWRGLAQSLQHEFRMDVYQHLQKLDISYFENKSTGNLVSIINDDINQLERFFNEGINSLVQILTSIILIGTVFFVLSPKIAVFSFVPMPFILLGAFYFQKKAAPLYARVRDQAGAIGARLSNNIAGMTTIRSFVREDWEVAGIKNDSLNYLGANREAIRLAAKFNPIIRMGVLFGFIMTFAVGGVMTLQGNLNVGTYGVLVFLTQRLLWPLRDLAGTVDLFERAMASTDRVLNLLSAPLNIELSGGSLVVSKNTQIEFRNLSFGYENKVEILKNLQLKIPNGQTVAIVGPTGSGKSTITKLLLRFYNPTSGDIFLGEKSIVDYNLYALRRGIGIVSQDVYLFHGTIFENISYGKPNATKAEVAAAAAQAHAEEFIKKFPQGFETIIGERGQKLSGGQRQRISIARVILKNPPILVLDEATSSVDNETESLIKKSLKQISKDRTTVLIAHRLSTVTHADHIYVLENGSIAEQGTHSQLLSNNHIYANLWRLQTDSLV